MWPVATALDSTVVEALCWLRGSQKALWIDVCLPWTEHKTEVNFHLISRCIWGV